MVWEKTKNTEEIWLSPSLSDQKARKEQQPKEAAKLNKSVLQSLGRKMMSTETERNMVLFPAYASLESCQGSILQNQKWNK
jgi:hypothetical protein